MIYNFGSTRRNSVNSHDPGRSQSMQAKTSESSLFTKDTTTRVSGLRLSCGQARRVAFFGLMLSTSVIYLFAANPKAHKPTGWGGGGWFLPV